MNKYFIADNALAAIPGEFLDKGWRSPLPIEAKPVDAPKTFIDDPFSTIQSYGYKIKRWSPTYEMLKSIVQRVGLVSSIINTRITQVTMFSSPYRRTRTLGYMIKPKDPLYKPTPQDQQKIVMMEDFIFNCGRGDRNPFSSRKRDNFREFLTKFVRDRLAIDQASFEIVPDKNGMPFEFVAVDGSTVRIAATRRDVSKTAGGLPAKLDVDSNANLNLTSMYANRAAKSAMSETAYIQLVNGQIVNTYTEKELAFCPYNVNTSIYSFGYGIAEIEQIMRVLTGMLNAETYNMNFFQNTSSPKGLLIVKTAIDQEALEAFKRQWYAMVAGVENAWKTPILQTDSAEWVNLSLAQRDAEFMRWLEYLIRIVCAVYLMDPAEVNFDISGQIPAQMGMETQAEWRVKKSKDRGLRPLLKFIADCLNRYVVDRLDPRFYLDFVGLDDLSQKERQDLHAQQITLYRTINEGRAQEDLPPLPGGDVPANPIYIQNMQLMQQQAMMQQQMAMQKQQGKQQEKKNGGSIKKSFHLIPSLEQQMAATQDLIQQNQQSKEEEKQKQQQNFRNRAAWYGNVSFLNAVSRFQHEEQQREDEERRMREERNIRRRIS